MDSPFIVTVAGATGKLGLRIIDHLLDANHVHVRAFCRNPSKLPEKIHNHSRITIIQGEINDKAKVQEAVHGASVVICTYLGGSDVMVDCQTLLIDACEAEGVARYFPSDYTFEFTNLKLGQHEQKDNQIKIHEYLQTKRVQAVHVLIGCFLETWLSGYFKLWHPQDNAIKYWGTGDEPYDLTTYDDCAAYVAAAALDPDATGFLRFRGDRKTTKQMAQLIESVYGTSPTLERRGSMDELFHFMQDEKRRHANAPWAYINWFYQYYCVNGQTLFDESLLQNSRYPNVKPLDVATYMRQNDVRKLAF